MEHAQRDNGLLVPTNRGTVRLNPYFNGTCSKSGAMIKGQEGEYAVLILILMEHAQRDGRI